MIRSTQDATLPTWMTALGFALVFATAAAAREGDPGFQVWDGPGATSVLRHSHAMGPVHVVAVRHGTIRYFTRDGELTFEQLMTGQFGFVPNCGLWEAVVMFDPYARRFLVAGFGDSWGCYDDVILAVSDDDDPHGEWARHTIHAPSFMGPGYPSSGHPHFLSIGIDDEAIYLAWNTHPPVFPELRKSWVLAYDRASLLDGPSPIINGFMSNPLTVSYAAAKTFGESPAQYLATTYGQPIGTVRLTLTAVREALTSPLLDHFILDVPPFEYGPFVIPSIDTDGLDSTGSGILRAVYRDGSLWVTHHAKPAGEDRVLAIWYEFRMNDWPVSGRLPTLHQQGVIDAGPGVHTWIPDLAVDAHGTVAFAYARSAANELQAVGSAFRRAGDPPGSLQGHTIIKMSEFSNPFPGPVNHAHVSSVTEDPDAPGIFSAGGPYRTVNSFGGVTKCMWAAPVHTIVAGDITGDGAVNVNDLLAVIDAWGKCPAPPQQCPADIAPQPNGDGVVNVNDVLTVINNWG